MIAKITGVLETVEGGAAWVRAEGGITYQVLVPLSLPPGWVGLWARA